MKPILISFGDSGLAPSAVRLRAQADNSGFFSTTIICSEYDLTDDFRLKHNARLKPGIRGYGYWIWKPQIISQCLATSPENAVIVYLDIGCHINPKGESRLSYYIEKLSSSATGILAFQAELKDSFLPNDGRTLLDLPDCKWIKGDALDFFGIRSNQDILNSQTIGAGIILIKNCESSRLLIQNWLDVANAQPHLFDDSPSHTENLPDFIEHRHDQAIFSIICKMNEVTTLSAYEYWYPMRNDLTKSDWDALKNCPFHAKRDKNYTVNRRIRNLLHGIWNKLSTLLRAN